MAGAEKRLSFQGNVPIEAPPSAGYSLPTESPMCAVRCPYDAISSVSFGESRCSKSKNQRRLTLKKTFKLLVDILSRDAILVNSQWMKVEINQPVTN